MASLCISIASTGRAEHGTRRTTPHDSYGTKGNLEDMVDYYKNLTELDVDEVYNIGELFSSWDTYYNSEHCDMYFIGIKNGDNSAYRSNISLIPFAYRAVVKTSYSILNQWMSRKLQQITNNK